MPWYIFCNKFIPNSKTILKFSPFWQICWSKLYSCSTCLSFYLNSLCAISFLFAWNFNKPDQKQFYLKNGFSKYTIFTFPHLNWIKRCFYRSALVTELKVVSFCFILVDKVRESLLYESCLDERRVNLENSAFLYLRKWLVNLYPIHSHSNSFSCFLMLKRTLFRKKWFDSL